MKTIHAFDQAVDTFSRGHDISADDILGSLARLLDDSGSPHNNSLPAAERAALLTDGSLSPDDLARAEADVADGVFDTTVASAYVGVTSRSFSTEHVAHALGVTPSAVRHRLAKGTLWAFKVGSGHRFPLWQFWPADYDPAETPRADGFASLRILPHLAEILRAIPADATSVELEGLMVTPRDDLGSRVPAMIPAWLASGGEAAPAIAAVAQLTEIW